MKGTVVVEVEFDESKGTLKDAAQAVMAALNTDDAVRWMQKFPGTPKAGLVLPPEEATIEFSVRDEAEGRKDDPPTRMVVSRDGYGVQIRALENSYGCFDCAVMLEVFDNELRVLAFTGGSDEAVVSDVLYEDAKRGAEEAKNSGR